MRKSFYARTRPVEEEVELVWNTDRDRLFVQSVLVSEDQKRLKWWFLGGIGIGV